MEFRDFGDGRAVRRPSIEEVELVEPATGLKGELAVSTARVDGGDFSQAAAEGEIIRSVLAGVDLSGSRWGPVTLSDVALTGVDLANAAWSPVTARRVEVVSCRATGWRLACDLAWDVYVADTRLDYASVEVGRVKGLLVFQRCTFAQARIGGDLSNVLMLDCDLAGVEFAATGARGADLRTSRLAGARGLVCLRGALISEGQAVTVAGQLAREAGLQVG